MTSSALKVFKEEQWFNKISIDYDSSPGLPLSPGQWFPFLDLLFPSVEAGIGSPASFCLHYTLTSVRLPLQLQGG